MADLGAIKRYFSRFSGMLVEKKSSAENVSSSRKMVQLACKLVDVYPRALATTLGVKFVSVFFPIL